MAFKRQQTPSPAIRIRLDDASNKFVRDQAKQGKFRSITKYMIWLIDRERNGTDTPMLQLEAALAANISRLAEEVSAARMSTEAGNAFLHAFGQMYVANTHEAVGDEKVALAARARARYEGLLLRAGKQLAEKMAEEANDEN